MLNDIVHWYNIIDNLQLQCSSLTRLCALVIATFCMLVHIYMASVKPLVCEQAYVLIFMLTGGVVASIDNYRDILFNYLHNLKQASCYRDGFWSVCSTLHQGNLQSATVYGQRRLVTIFAECTYAMYVFADSAGWPGLRGRTLQPMANAL